MKRRICCLALVCFLLLTGCGPNKSVEQRVQEAFDQGYKAGKAAGTTVYESDWDVVAENELSSAWEEGYRDAKREDETFLADYYADGFQEGYHKGYAVAQAGNAYDPHP